MNQATAAPLRLVAEPTPLPHVDGGFKTILADPPWRFQNRTGKVAPEHRRLDSYSTLSVDEICAIDVASIAAKNAHLYLWVPNAMLVDGLRVRAKRRKDGGPEGSGVRFHFLWYIPLLGRGGSREATDGVVVRGSMRTLAPARSQVNMIETRKREHSRKPDEQYELIEMCSPGPYLEMFARYPQDGWRAWGDESPEDVQPRGQQHKGYSGGTISRVPRLEPNVRLDAGFAEQLGVTLRQQYEAGKSIRQLTVETGYTIARVRRLLKQGGTALRPQGRASSLQN